MPALKIKDKNGNWVTVNVLKGVTDQTYNPKSENAQSGKAVAEALENCASVIKNTKSGSIVTMNDVSPAQHSLDIKLNAAIEVLDFARLTSTTTFFVGESVIRLTTASEGFTKETLSELCPELKEGDIVTIKWQSPDDGRYVALVGASFISSSNDGNYYCRKYTVTEASLNNSVEISGLMGDINNLSITIENTEIDFSSVKVSRYGKNLQPYPYYSKSSSSNGITFTVNADNSININGTATANTDFNFVNGQAGYRQFIKAGTYTISGNPTDMGMNMFLYEERNSTSNYAVYGTKNGVPTTFTIINDSYYFWYIRVPNGKSVNNTTLYPQIEVGTTATEYKPYKEPQTVTANEDGTVEGLKSISPNMTIFTDTAGVIINATYNVDTKTYIDRKFAELSQALLNL